MNICIFIKSKNTAVVLRVTQYMAKYHANASLTTEHRWNNTAKQLNYSLQNKLLNTIILHI